MARSLRIVVATCLSLVSLSFAADEPTYSESLRPQYHFTAKKNWLNDPNGMCYADGVYHMFFQYCEETRESTHKSWGHATSPDMVCWTEGPVALSPDKLGDMWSGSGVIDTNNTSGFGDGKTPPMVLMYTAAGDQNEQSKGQKFTQCLAYSADGGKMFKKYEKNPVINQVRGGNRDPRLLWHEPSKQWIVVFYLDGDDFTFYGSKDFKTWTHLQDIHVPGCSECPDFYEMPIEGEPGKTAWVWTNANARYLVGEFDGKQFKPEHGFNSIQSEFGNGFYAGQTFSDLPDMRRVQIAWMWHATYPGMPFNQQMTFATELKLHRTSDGLRLFRMPVGEIKNIREREEKLSDIELDERGVALDGLETDKLDLDLTINVGSAKRVGLRVGGQSIDWDSQRRELSCLNMTAPLSPIDGQIKLRVLVDRTTIEIFGNDGVISMSNAFVSDPQGFENPPRAFAEGGQAKLVSWDGFALKSIWPQP